MSRNAPPPVADTLLVGRLAELLADLGEDGLTEALDLLVEELSLRSAFVRDGDPGACGRLRAVAGEPVHAVPAMRVVSPGETECATVELPLRAGGRDIGVLAVIGARPSQLPLLRTAASVLSLTLASSLRSELADTADDLVAAADGEAAAAADGLHDGPVQALVVAHYAAEAAVRGGDPAAARDAVQAALVELRRALWHLRPRTENGLPDALGLLSGRLEEAGGPPLAFVCDELLAQALPPAVVSMAYRLVQAVAVPVHAGPVRVALRREGGSVVVDVEGGAPLTDESRWTTTARALGGSLSATDGRIRLAVPLSASKPLSAPNRPRPKATS